MKNKFIKYLLLCGSFMALFSACRKDSFKGTETGSSGKTFVWINEAPQFNQFFLPFTDTKAVSLFKVRRDAASSGDLQKSVTITLTALSIDDYNTAHGTSYLPIDNPLATPATDNSIATTATGITMKFGPGEFAKNYVVNVDGSNFDASKKYALLYVLSSTDGLTKKAGPDTILTTLGVKNKYDGVYHASGTFVRVGLDQRAISEDKTLTTINANTVQSTVADLGASYPINLIINADNTITIDWLGGDGLPGPYTQVGENFYDPATKTFTLNYQYRGGARTTSETLTLK